MMPLSHSTSDGQLEDLDGPSDLRPMMAPSSQFLRNLRYAGEGAAVERLLVRVEGVHRLLALDHVVLEHASGDRRADLVVVLVERRVRRREERVVAAREVDAVLESAAESWSKLS